MVIGGLQKNSFIDYPGKISCVLFLCGCNFHCPYCQNPDLVKCTDSSAYTREDLFVFLESHRDFVDGVVISGGEPTIQPDLISLCRDIKATGFPIKLDTNGSRPRILKTLITEGLIDYIAMDVKTDPYAYESLIQEKADPVGLLNGIEMIKDAGLPHEFRTTCVRPFVSRPIVAHIARLIDGAAMYALQRFNPGKVLFPEFFQEVDKAIDDTEMMEFKAIADSYVNTCIIR